LHSKELNIQKQKAKKKKFFFFSLGETNFVQAKIPLAWAKNLSLGRK